MSFDAVLRVSLEWPGVETVVIVQAIRGAGPGGIRS